MKKVLSLFMAFVMLSSALFSFSQRVSAQDFIENEKTRLGSSDTYYYYDRDTKTLTISGIGATPNYDIRTNLPWYAHRNDGSIEKIVVEEGITALGNYLFYQIGKCEVKLPYSLRKILNYTFSSSQIAQLDLPFGLISIGTYAFYNCRSLNTVHIPDTVTTIGNRAFQECSALTEVMVPYSVKSLGSYAFYNCINLENVTFQSLTSGISISSYCFASCVKLKSVNFPMNSNIGTCAFGFQSKSSKYADVVMNVYDSSPAHVYAITNKFTCSILEKIPMECGVKYVSSYSDETQNDIFTFEFTADSSLKYNFYSCGGTDVKATLKDSAGKEIAKDDDRAINDRNFLISENLNQGETYYLEVSSLKSSGDFTVQVYPDLVSDIDTIGCIEFNANDSVEQDNIKHFEISDIALSELILNVKFINGYSDMMYYSTDYFNGAAFKYVDTQSETPYTCGLNKGVLAFKDVTGTFDVMIHHSYTQEIIAPTVDDDGYTLHTCVLCGAEYKSDFVKTTAVTVSGRLVLAENKAGGCSHGISYPYASFYANGRVYKTDENGYFSFNTFDSTDITFLNENGKDKTVHFEVNGENADYGMIAMEGYDFNKDGCTNLKDYQIYLNEKRSEYDKNYLDFFGEFV